MCMRVISDRECRVHRSRQIAEFEQCCSSCRIVPTEKHVSIWVGESNASTTLDKSEHALQVWQIQDAFPFCFLSNIWYGVATFCDCAFNCQVHNSSAWVGHINVFRRSSR